MAKKSVVGEVVDAAKSAAGAALGAAAAAATEVVLTRVSEAMRGGGKKLEDAAPRLQTTAAATVTKPLVRTKQKRAAAPLKTKVAAKRKAASKTAAAKTGKKR